MKIVKESLNFERSTDPLKNLDIGRKVLIEKWLNKMEIENYIINDDFTIDVDGNVILSGRKIIEFPYFIQFGKINGPFYCNNNQLISLKGSPITVETIFNCNHNKLTSLEGSPQKVGRDFYCKNNYLTNLKGSPKEVGGSFSCGNNHLISLEGAPLLVVGNFHNSYNPKEFTIEDVKNVCEVKGDIFLK